MTQLVPIEQVGQHLSDLAKQRAASGTALNQNFSDGVKDSFPVLSIKGKVFRARISGEETAFIDPATRAPVPFLDIVLVNASRALSKSYYAKGFTEGDLDPPQCWSLDSFKPDVSVMQKVSPTCQTCPMNQFGSRITENGKAAKACSDARRVAVVMPHQLGQDAQMLMLLRIPQSSLKNLKIYAELLARHQIEPGGCITRIGFDYQEAFPKLLFNFVAPLNDVQYQKVIDLAELPGTSAMLNAPDFDMAVSTPPQGNATPDAMAGQAQQAAPVLANLLDAGEQVQEVNTGVQGAPATSIITLPDGKKFDTVTGQYVVEEVKVEIVDPTKAEGVIPLPDGRFFDTKNNSYVDVVIIKQEEPVQEVVKVLDPATLTLPNGQFFHTLTQKFVTGPHKGDPEAGAPAPVTEEPKRKRRSSAEVAAEKAAKEAEAKQQAHGGMVDSPVPGEQPGPTSETSKLADLVAGASQQNNAAPQEEKPKQETAPANGVGAAPASLEALLGQLVPPSGS